MDGIGSRSTLSEMGRDVANPVVDDIALRWIHCQQILYTKSGHKTTPAGAGEQTYKWGHNSARPITCTIP